MTGDPMTGERRLLKVAIVAGEHSGDRLGARLMSALQDQAGCAVQFAGVGGSDMEAVGLDSHFPMSDVAVMGLAAIFRNFRRIVGRVYDTVNLIVTFQPDVLVIIDSPEFTHQIAKRVRKRCPDIPIVDYVSPSVWAWRSGRAAKMRHYVDHVLALLPFEPAAHQRLGGPACTYVGHPIIEKLNWLQALDPAPLRAGLGIAEEEKILALLPGSRTSEVSRLLPVFVQTIEQLVQRIGPVRILVPTLDNVREITEQLLAGTSIQYDFVEGEEDKFRAFKMVDAAIATSGTVTLEVALTGTPMVVGYRTDVVTAQMRRFVKVHSVVLPNLILERNLFPELLQEDCLVDKLLPPLLDLMVDGPARQAQIEGCGEIAKRMQIDGGSPSQKAAHIVLSLAQQ